MEDAAEEIEPAEEMAAEMVEDEGMGEPAGDADVSAGGAVLHEMLQRGRVRRDTGMAAGGFAAGEVSSDVGIDYTESQTRLQRRRRRGSKSGAFGGAAVPSFASELCTVH